MKLCIKQFVSNKMEMLSGAPKTNVSLMWFCFQALLNHYLGLNFSLGSLHDFIFQKTLLATVDQSEADHNDTMVIISLISNLSIAIYFNPMEQSEIIHFDV